MAAFHAAGRPEQADLVADGGLGLSGQRGGVVADDRIDVSIRIEDGLANADGLSRILVGVVRIMDSNPRRILFLDVRVAGDVPGVLVGNGRVGEVPDVLDFAVHVHAALLQAFEHAFIEVQRGRRCGHGAGLGGEHGLVALGVFGFVRVSELVSALEPSIRGRLVVFFPGEYENGNYRFLDARDGWSYRAVPILASEGAFAS